METLGEDTRFATLPSVSATMLTDKGIYSASLSHSGEAEDSTSATQHHPPVRKNSSVDCSDPAVKKVVYNLYRGLLGTYNEKANGMINSLPAERVREDQGITRQVESMMRQSAEITGTLGCRQGPCEEPRPAMAQSTGSFNAGGSFPPPPPPPMPTNGSIPSIRLQSETGPVNSNANKGGKHIPGGGAPFSYIPPAAIQNAMMSKDKKPFTYTPGGIDLSEIRSPRIQRRISKNAADEGVATAPAVARSDASGVPAPPPLPPQALAAMQPQLAVPVFPTKLQPSSPPPAPAMAAPMLINAPPPPPPPPVLKSTAFMEAEERPVHPLMINSQSRNTGNASTNGEATRYPAPSYHHQPSSLSPLPDSSPANYSPRNSPAESPLPEAQPFQQEQQQQQNRVFTDRRNVQVGSIYIPPVTSSVPAPSTSPSSFTPQLSKSPMPWMNSQNRAQNQSPPPPPFVQEISRATDDSWTGSTGNVRVIPLHIEGRDPAPVAPTQNTLNRQQSAGTRIIPIQVEGGCQPISQPQQYHQPQQPQYQSQYQQQQQSQYQQLQSQYHQQQQQQPQYQQQPPWRTNVAANQITPMVENLQISGNANDPRQQERLQPIQSRSFRILQMITDTQPEDAGGDQDSSDSGRQSQNSVRSGPPPVGERRLQLTQDDRELMDMFRAQVSEESSLHQEPDPRYRGSHIPSRAFRILQNFTDTSDSAPTGQQQPPMARQQSVNRYGQQYAGSVAGNSRGNAPVSEQNAPEPRKYMGGSIPSRSFRMLQQMTAPEDESLDQSHVAEISDDGYETQNSHGEFLHSLLFSPLPNTPVIHSPLANPQDSKDHFGSVLTELKNFKFKYTMDPPQQKESPTSRGPVSCVEDTASLVTPTIRVEDYEQNADPRQREEIPAANSNPANLQTNPIDSEADSSESSEAHLEGRNHCRLFRLLSTDSQESSEATQPSMETGVNTSDGSFIQELDSNLPRAVPGAHVRLRSLRPRSYIPSRFFRFLQQEFDSSASEDISSPVSIEKNFFSQISSTTTGESSAASELEGYFGAN